MARNVREALRMVEASRSARLVTVLYPPRPGLKGDRVMKRLLSDGFVGDIREVRVTSMAHADEPAGYDWRTSAEAIGVNAMTLGMWAEVLHRWVGPVARVSAVAKSPGAGQVPVSISIAAELRCGATASYHFASSGAFLPGHSIEIYGSSGALVYRLFAEEILGASGGNKSLEPIPVPQDEERAHSTDLEFIEAIREGKPAAPDFEEGLRYMEFCEAVALSALAGSEVALPLPGPAMSMWNRRLE